MIRLELRERQEGLRGDDARHALDLVDDGLAKVLGAGRADADHDVRVPARADDLRDHGQLLQLGDRLLRVRRADQHVRADRVPVGLLLGPVPEGRIAPEAPNVIQQLDLGLEAPQGFRVLEVARDRNVVSPKDGLGARDVRVAPECRQRSLHIAWRHLDEDDAGSTEFGLHFQHLYRYQARRDYIRGRMRWALIVPILDRRYDIIAKYAGILYR